MAALPLTRAAHSTAGRACLGWVTRRATASRLRYLALTCERPSVLPYCSASPLPFCMASVSLCRAAGRRWGAGAFSALQMRVMFGTRHQGKAGLHLRGLTWSDLSTVQGVTEDRLRTRKPFIHAVVAVSSVSAVQMSTPRGQSPADVLPLWPACRCLGLLHMPWRGKGGWGTPPIKVLPEPSQTRVVSSARMN